MVYKTDAGISKKVRIAYEVPLKDGPSVSYPVAGIRESKQIEASTKFLAYLASTEAQRVFLKYGFIVQK